MRNIENVADAVVKMQRKVIFLVFFLSIFCSCKSRESSEVKDAQSLNTYFWKDHAYVYRGECDEGQTRSKECCKNLSKLPLSNLTQVRETLTQSIGDYEYLQTTNNAALFKQYVEQSNEDQKHLLSVLDTLEDPKQMFIVTTKLERDFLDSIFDQRAFMPVKSVSLGSRHTCAIFESDELKCWGQGGNGQLGLGDDKNQADAVRVKSVIVEVNQVSAGSYHTCAVLKSGELKCWGYSAYGRLGMGKSENKNEANDVPPILNDVSRIASGGRHTCALLNSGSLKCWGFGGNGQLGLGDRQSEADASKVRPVLTGVSQVELGASHTCAILKSGELKCWGIGEGGQLGLGDEKDQLDAVHAKSVLVDVRQVALGNSNTCAVMKSGELKCWGTGVHGEVDDVDDVDPGSIVDASTVKPTMDYVSKVALGWSHTCVIQESGDLKCWGVGASGQLGFGNQDALFEAPAKPILSDVRQVALGTFHSCAILNSGELKCWGSNDTGQLGNPALKKFGVNYGDEPGETLDKLPPTLRWIKANKD